MERRGRESAGRGPVTAPAWAVAAAISISISACSSVSLKEPAPVVSRSPARVLLPALRPAPADYAASAASSAAAASSPDAASAAASAPVAVALPVLTPTLPPPVPMPVAAPVRPVSPAVAARFPEPAVAFLTPAFAEGRRDFTSNAELHDVLRGLSIGDGARRRTSIELLAIGTSGWGTPIEALAFTRPPPPVVSAADVARRPAVIVVGGQHGDEPASTEALMVVAQDLAGGPLARVLEQIDVILLPRANPDGADALQRALASGIDLDADHLLLRSPEARAMASLMTRFDPMVVVDLREYLVDGRFEDKFGGVPRADVLLDHATVANVAPFITKAAEEWFREPLSRALTTAGYIADWDHRTSAELADRRVSMGGVAPGLARNAGGLRNAVSLSVASRRNGEARRDLRRRVQAQVLAVSQILNLAARRAADLGKLRQFVERDVTAQACQGEVVLAAAPTPGEHALGLLDPETAALKRVTVVRDSSLQLRALTSRPRPCGYWLAASETEAVQRLQALGVDVQQIDQDGEFRGQTYREAGPGGPEAGSAPAGLRVQLQPALVDVPAGGYYVSLEQPLALLAIAALEPEAPGSYPAEGVIGSIGAVARVMSRPTFRLVDVR